jgi:hypothetical protein
MLADPWVSGAIVKIAKRYPTQVGVPEFLGGVRDLLSHPEAEARLTALRLILLLRDHLADQAELFEDLANRLYEEHGPVRARALQTVAELGPTALRRPVLDALLTTLRDGNPDLRALAAQALRQTGLLTGAAFPAQRRAFQALLAELGQ